MLKYSFFFIYILIENLSFTTYFWRLKKSYFKTFRNVKKSFGEIVELLELLFLTFLCEIQRSCLGPENL